jgi:hypothetical protein
MAEDTNEIIQREREIRMQSLSDLGDTYEDVYLLAMNRFSERKKKGTLRRNSILQLKIVGHGRTQKAQINDTEMAIDESEINAFVYWQLSSLAFIQI